MVQAVCYPATPELAFDVLPTGATELVRPARWGGRLARHLKRELDQMHSEATFAQLELGPDGRLREVWFEDETIGGTAMVVFGCPDSDVAAGRAEDERCGFGRTRGSPTVFRHQEGQFVC